MIKLKSPNRLAFGVIAASILVMAACAGNNPALNNGQNVPLGTATHDQIVQTAVAVTQATKLASDKATSATTTYTDPVMQQMATLLQPCVYTPNNAGGGTLGGASCPINYIQKYATGSSSTYYTVLSQQYLALNFVQNLDVTNLFSWPNTQSALTGTISVIVGTTNWGNVTFTGTVNQTAPSATGTYTSVTTLTGASSVAKAVLVFNVAGHVDSAAGNFVTDSQTCTLDGAAVTCVSIGG